MWSQYPFRLLVNSYCIPRYLRCLQLSSKTFISPSGIDSPIKTVSIRNFGNLTSIITNNQTFQRAMINSFTNIARGMAMDVESVPPPYEYIDPKSEDEVVNVIFVSPDGQETKVRGKIGDNLLLLALRYNVDLEGACEAQLACTSCHVYVDEQFEDILEEPTKREDDLLDSAPFLKPNSRLGCQIILKKEFDGLRLTIPQATINFYVDGHKPKKH